MSWFIFAFAATLSWGLADIFYKKGADDGDRYSHLKTAVWVGLVMGVAAAVLMPFSESGFDAVELIKNMLYYSPASFCYIASMVIGYAGLRYLELSVASPVQNASGALSAILILLWMLIKGNITNIGDELSALDIIGTVIIVIGVIFLAVTEQQGSRDEAAEKKYRTGALALIFPLLYCVFDTLGTSADGIILDGEAGLGLGEIDVLIVYGLTFLLFGIGAWVVMLIKTKKAYNPFGRHEGSKMTAALFEEGGQIFYVYAMARKPIVAAPMIASYCIVSVLLSRIFLKEKPGAAKYASVAAVIVGIVMLGISEGLAEA